MKKITNKNDPKFDTITMIWSYSTGMLAICIPLVSASESGVILPLAVILGASISTVVVWYSDRYKSFKLVNKIQQIEQRIEALEIICVREYNSSQINEVH